LLYVSTPPLSPSTSAALVAVFVVVFIVSRQALGQSELFSGGTRTPISLCVALLSVLSIGPTMTDAILLPYLALVVCLPFLFLLWLLDRRQDRAQRSELRYRQEPGAPERRSDSSASASAEQPKAIRSETGPAGRILDIFHRIGDDPPSGRER